MKKQYFYDYKTTLAPNDHSASTSTQETGEQETTVTPTMGHGEVITPHTPSNAPTPTEPLSQTGGFDPLPSERRRFSAITPMTVILLLAVIVLGYLVYRNRPQTFQACSNLPGSKLSNTYPQLCTTIYGSKFVKDTFGTQALDDMTTFKTNNDLETDIPELEPFDPESKLSDGAVAGSMTKGGLPIDTVVQDGPVVTPAQQPTASPTNAPPSTSNELISHRYLKQGFKLLLPRTWSSNAVKDVNTGITTVKMWDDHVDAPEMMIQIQPNWDNTGDAKNQSINFEVDGHSAIKIAGEHDSTLYYFEGSNGQVYVTTCAANAASQCEAALKSLVF